MDFNGIVCSVLLFVYEEKGKITFRLFRRKIRSFGGGSFMSIVYKFLRECGYFYVLTVNGDFPAGRPFGAVMEYNGKLYISTNDGNKAHQQIRNNGNIQILAKKEGTREWIRITGIATESIDIKLKQKMLEECPILTKHFSTAESEHYLLFEVEVLNTEFN